MNTEKRIHPEAVLALKEALAVIYWKKEHLQDFIKLSLTDNSLIGTVNWNGTKREAVREIIERMISDIDIYKNDLINLIVTVSNFRDFDNLKFGDEDGSKTKAAKAAVENLRIHAKTYNKQTDEEQEIQKCKIETEKSIAQNKSLNEELNKLKTRFQQLTTTKDLQKRGFELEKFLYDLFLLYELEPKGSFKNYGEQIDGAFTFQGTDYLLEAKWKRQVDRGELASFCYKVETKLKTALGLVVTIDGITKEAISPDFKSIIIMDGFDLAMVLEGRVSFTDLLARKRRKAIETGKIYLNFSQL